MQVVFFIGVIFLLPANIWIFINSKFRFTNDIYISF